MAAAALVLAVGERDDGGFEVRPYPAGDDAARSSTGSAVARDDGEAARDFLGVRLAGVDPALACD